MDKKFWSTAFTLTGTIIGAGILGLPYVFSKSGSLIGVSWLLVLGLIVIITLWYFPSININNFSYNNLRFLFLPFGVILFVLIHFLLIKEFSKHLLMKFF